MDLSFRYIERHYGVHTVAIVHDFQSTTEESMEVINEIIDTLEVGILINNVGIHYEYPMEFVEVYTVLNYGTAEVYNQLPIGKFINFVSQSHFYNFILSSQMQFRLSIRVSLVVSLINA